MRSSKISLLSAKATVIASTTPMQTISRLYSFFMWFKSWFRETLGCCSALWCCLLCRFCKGSTFFPPCCFFADLKGFHVACWAQSVSRAASRMLMSSINKSTVHESGSSQEQQGSSSRADCLCMWHVDDQKHWLDTCQSAHQTHTHILTAIGKRE